MTNPDLTMPTPTVVAAEGVAAPVFADCYEERDFWAAAKASVQNELIELKALRVRDLAKVSDGAVDGRDWRSRSSTVEAAYNSHRRPLLARVAEIDVRLSDVRSRLRQEHVLQEAARDKSDAGVATHADMVKLTTVVEKLLVAAQAIADEMRLLR